MALQPGTSLGSYSVTAKIGEGGMGEVYRARDTKLDRDVALKVLPQAFTEDPDRPGATGSVRRLAMSWATRELSLGRCDPQEGGLVLFGQDVEEPVGTLPHIPDALL